MLWKVSKPVKTTVPATGQGAKIASANPLRTKLYVWNLTASVKVYLRFGEGGSDLAGSPVFDEAGDEFRTTDEVWAIAESGTCDVRVVEETLSPEGSRLLTLVETLAQRLA